MARTCPNCAAGARDDDRFCGRCGNALAAGAAGERPEGFCTRCGAPLGARDRFCARCGAAAPGVDRPGPPHDESFDPDDFFRNWERPTEAPDEAKTEQVHLRPTGRSDTAVLPEIPPDAPEERRPPPGPREPAPSRGFPWGATFAFLGAVAVVASSALPWIRGDDLVLPRDVAVATLLFGSPAARGPSLGLVLLGLGMAGALVALLTMAIPALRFLRRLVGLVTLAAPVLFVVRVAGAELGRVLEVLAPGVYVAAAGALVQMIAGRWFRR